SALAEASAGYGSFSSLLEINQRLPDQRAQVLAHTLPNVLQMAWVWCRFHGSKVVCFERILSVINGSKRF
ncbi:MAG: hypothetical protein ACEQSB_08025, partial [Undibacterium sp.]